MIPTIDNWAVPGFLIWVSNSVCVLARQSWIQRCVAGRLRRELSSYSADLTFYWQYGYSLCKGIPHEFATGILETNPSKPHCHVNQHINISMTLQQIWICWITDWRDRLLLKGLSLLRNTHLWPAWFTWDNEWLWIDNCSIVFPSLLGLTALCISWVALRTGVDV